MRTPRPLTTTIAVTAGVLLAACGSSPSASSHTTAANSVTSTAPAGAVDPNAPEVVEPGDIPDNQVFVPFTWADGGVTVDVPEGWARTTSGQEITFTDKYNSITIAKSTAASPPTVESVTSTGLSDVSSDPTFALTDVKPVSRKGGDGILARYEIASAPNAVTGKKAQLAVERYVFAHNGEQVALTLSGAKGADNVDPWRIVSDSLTWT